MATEIKNRLKRIGEPSFFHDSRADARTISKFCNEIADKVNELIRENNQLREELESIKTKQ